MLQDLIAFVEHGTLGELVRENDLLFPFIESVHVLAVCLVVGSIAVVDLRLLGFASVDRPVGRLMRSILPITVGAFGLAVAAGSLLFISHASKYLENRFFIAKASAVSTAPCSGVIVGSAGSGSSSGALSAGASTSQPSPLPTVPAPAQTTSPAAVQASSIAGE